MSKINIEYDTVTKECSVSGVDYAGINEIRFVKTGNEPPTFICDMYASKIDEENNIYHMYHMMCKKYEEQQIQSKVHDLLKKLNSK